MPKKSIIETIADKRKKKKRKKQKQKVYKKFDKIGKEIKISDLERRKLELEAKIKEEKARLEDGTKASDQKEFSLDKDYLDSDLKASQNNEEPEFIEQLIEKGRKEGWNAFINYNLKNKIKINFPPIDPSKCKFSDYGYRRFLELLFESPELLRLMIEVKDISDFQIVTLNPFIRGDDPTIRGIEALCGLIINKITRYNPVSETDFKYLNIILDSFTIPNKEGINKTWNIKTEKKEIKIIANFDTKNREWVYKLDQS